MDVGVWGAESCDASDALSFERVGPREVEVYDDGRVLEVDAFGEQVGGEEESNGLMWWWLRLALCVWREAGDGIEACDASAGDAGVHSGEGADASDVGEGAIERMDGVTELREGDDGRVGVSYEDLAQGVFACGVRRSLAALSVEQGAQRGEVFVESVEEGAAVWLRLCEEFWKGELHLVVADEPGAQFGLTWMSASVERLSECFASEEASSNDMTEGGVAGAPGAEQAESDERASDGTVSSREWIGEGEYGVEGFAVLRRAMTREPDGRVFVYAWSRADGRLAVDVRGFVGEELLADDEMGQRIRVEEIVALSGEECEEIAEFARRVVYGGGGEEEQVATGDELCDGVVALGVAGAEVVCFIDHNQFAARPRTWRAIPVQGMAIVLRCAANRAREDVQRVEGYAFCCGSIDRGPPHRKKRRWGDDVGRFVVARQSECDVGLAESDFVGEEGTMESAHRVADAREGMALMRHEGDVADGARWFCAQCRVRQMCFHQFDVGDVPDRDGVIRCARAPVCHSVAHSRSG
jgi:hypothetical protein